MVDINKIIQYRMVDGDLTSHNPPPEYSLQYVDINNYKSFIDDITEISKLIIDQIPDWGDAPTVETVIKRFESNSYTYLFYYKDTCIGWNWGNPNFTYNWIDVDQVLEDNETYLGGCFVNLNKDDRPNNSGYSMCHMFFKQEIDRGVKSMYGITDDWNRRASILYYRLGWKTYNFIK
tara:strand:+ start:141 stop:671 length:531 start_codon:yes stop_codon:yes gene_type:complete